jgi:ABC-2 type transport system ATP-binding protein
MPEPVTAAAPAPAMIRTVDLRVDYGEFTAVSDLCLEVPRGEIYGLIGPNGAGKTSTMKVLATLLEPTYGEVYVGGVDVNEDPQGVHRLLGYMPDWAPVIADLRIWEFLDLFAAAYGVPKADRASAVDRAIDGANLAEKRDALSGGLSRGMKQRLVLAKTLLHDPEVLILDEPASGLDPLARIELRDVIKGLAERGKTVMVSSHILTELQSFCTSFGIMQRGRLLVSGGLDQILAKLHADRAVAVDVLGDPALARSVLAGLPGVHGVQARGEHTLVVAFAGSDEELAAALRALVVADVPVKGFHEERPDVEDVFLALGRGEVDP